MPTNITAVPETNETNHPLLAREIRPLQSWTEFLERWGLAKSVEEMLGLLHVGFAVPYVRYHHDDKEYDLSDRILFYLNIADGWSDYFDILRKPEDREVHYRWQNNEGQTTDKNPSELRQIVAQKSFDVLCLNVFKSAKLRDQDRDNGFKAYWEETFTSDRLFPVIQTFFRDERDNHLFHRYPIRNLTLKESTSHNEKFAHEFLVNLAQFMWNWQARIPSWAKEKELEAIEEKNRAMRIRLDQAKPWMVGVLVELKRLDVLREWILLLDKDCLGRLRQIAMRNNLQQYRHPVGKDRKVKNLDEACYLGSRAAWFLKEYELVVQEHKRLTAIREAEIASEKANQRIKQLTPKE